VAILLTTTNKLILIGGINCGNAVVVRKNQSPASIITEIGRTNTGF
jgi:hypothetical protein